MSYKISFLLSTLFIALFFLLGMDMMNIQYIYTDLDSKALNIAYTISKRGYITDDFIDEIESRYNVIFQEINPEEPMFGEVFDFIICRNYKPIILSQDSMTLKVKRSGVIGYYG